MIACVSVSSDFTKIFFQCSEILARADICFFMPIGPPHGYIAKSQAPMRNRWAASVLARVLWKLKEHERFIVSSKERRAHHLQLVVNSTQWGGLGCSPKDWHRKFSLAWHANCHRIGWRVTATHRYYWKPLSSLNATAVLATRQPMGSISVAPLVASPPATRRLFHSKIFGSTRYAKTSLPFCFGSAP